MEAGATKPTLVMVVQVDAVSVGIRGIGVGSELRGLPALLRCLCPVVQQLRLSGAALGHDLWVLSRDITFNPPRPSVSFLIAFTQPLFCLN